MTVIGLHVRCLVVLMMVLPGGCQTASVPDSDVVAVAERELERMDIDYNDREVSIESDADDARVTFHLPTKMLGGHFEVLVDRSTLTIENVKIWR